MSDAPVVDLDACAAEPIRIPGAIQPHGALAFVDRTSFRILNASANLAEFTCAQAAPGDILGGVASGELGSELTRWLAQGEGVFARTVALGGRRLQVSGRETPQGLLVEFEAAPEGDGDTLEQLYPRLQSFLGEIARAQDLDAIAEAAVREVRLFTGFNRTLLYTFDAKGDGAVIAEDNDGVLPAYLGQRFPGSDIPPQARDLYLLSRVRLIANCDYQPCPVLPAASPIDGQPLDLSQAALRSVSPVHLEYMRNMGTGSSMSISIVVDGKLWGLISGHGAEPRYVNAQVRAACDVLGQVLSLQIEARLKADVTAERLKLKQVETELLAALAAARSFQAGLARNAELWMGLTRAAGAAVVSHGVIQIVGQTPPREAIIRLTEHLHAGRVGAFATDSMAETCPEATAFAEMASGLLAISISQLHPDFILWFRPEVVRTIEWAGDPTKPMTGGAAGRLHPRTSFAAWLEQVRQRSLPWSASEVEAATDFRSSIQSLVLKRAEERAELTDRLERANKELESFSYSISHDLRAPFRHVAGFAELLADREKNLDEKSLHYLQSIIEAALAAGRLVDDLLHFSQLGRSNLNLMDIDMNKLVAEVRRSIELDPTHAGRRIEWRIGQLPAVSGDAPMLRQVMQNLIENAAKYSAPRDVATIEVRGEETGDAVRYTVRDNGVGFDPDYAHKLFGVFQRLHRAEEFEGTGIGLALVKRIVDRHGGVVSARGTLGEGAEFSFTIPKVGRAGEQEATVA